ncbi:MAG: hypothetical protein ACE3L7_12060 [Candidatus Pristimantibacillus sp.]
MNRMKLSRSAYWFVGLMLLILCVDSLAVRIAPEEQLLTFAVLFDFMIVVPFLYWLFIVRKSGRKLTALMPIPMLGALAAWLVLPSSMRGAIWQAAWPIELLIIAAEVSILVYEARLIILTIRRFKQIRSDEPDTAEAIKKSVADVAGQSKLASFIVHDISMIYYLFFSWKRKRVREQSVESEFTYHRETNQVLMAAIVTKILVIEMAVVHLLLMQWSPIAAWIITALELWTLILIWADCRAAVLRPIKLNNGQLRIRYGLRIQADIPLSHIAEITSSTSYEISKTELSHSAGPVFGTSNVKILLKHEARVEGIFYWPRNVRTIYLAVDQPAELVNKTRQAMEWTDSGSLTS